MPLYPVTLIRTRYGGIYEGGEWAAFPIHSDEIPVEVEGDDVTCATWWSEFGHAVGVGASPDAALADLEEKCDKSGRRIPYRIRSR